jgi:hypothetical protein
MSELFKKSTLNIFRTPYVNARGFWKHRVWSGSPTLGTVQYRCIEIILIKPLTFFTSQSPSSDANIPLAYQGSPHYYWIKDFFTYSQTSLLFPDPSTAH